MQKCDTSGGNRIWMGKDVDRSECENRCLQNPSCLFLDLTTKNYCSHYKTCQESSRKTSNHQTDIMQKIKLGKFKRALYSLQ